MDKDKSKNKSSADLNPSDILQSVENCSNQKIEKRAPSLSSIKSKKSSNILAALVRRTRRNKNKNAEQTIEKSVCSSQNLNLIASNSSLGIHTEEELEINTENYEKPCESVEMPATKTLSKREISNTFTTDSDHSIIEASKAKNQFFRKFIKKQNSSENTKKMELLTEATNTSNVNSTCKVCQIDNISQSGMKKEHHEETYFSSCYINFGKPSLPPTLSNGLQMVQDFITRLKESETHFIQIFTRYIKDSTFQKELIETLSQHSKLQWETERRTSALANEMWVQQIEIGRAQEKTLQETLNSLVKQNRQLQVENEILFRKHEKLLRKVRNFGDLGMRHKCMDCDVQVEHVFRHNEKLQHKLEEQYREAENLESELHMMQKHNENLELQLRSCSSNNQNLKALLTRSKTDYELEITSLNHEIQKNDKIIKEAVNAGDILLEDLESIKRQSKSTPLSINWAKFKCRGSALVDLIHMCRSCLNEFSKDILSLHTQIALKDKDIENLQHTNSKLQENLKKSVSELDNLSKKLEEGSSKESDKFLSDQRCQILQTDLKILEEKMEKVKIQYEVERNSLLNTIADYEQLSNELADKDKMIEQTKIYICNITSENMTLRGQVEGLNKLIMESGSGDVVKELTHSQEQLVYYQTQYNKLVNENHFLMEQQNVLKADKKAALEHQEANFKQLHKRLQELECIGKENALLRQQYETEHETVISLQNERMKYLEEKNMLKSIFNHMKVEISRVQKLEGTVSDISKEASKLAMIAEYNKQLGQKLKTEIVEKDKTILLLKSSVEKLNDIQLKDTKEKMSLCYELSEVCQLKNQLSKILTAEVEKRSALDNSKKEIIQTTKSQLKKFEEVQKNDRSTLKDVVKDLKMVIAQRDKIKKEKEDLEAQVAQLKVSCGEWQNKYDALVFQKNEIEINMKEVTTKLNETEKMVNNLQEQLQKESSKYGEDIGQLKKLIIQLRKEKEEADNSILYLQNNTQKLYRDLNDARKSEKNTADELKKCTLEKSNLQSEKDNILKDVESLGLDKSKLSEELYNLNFLCEKILESFETNMKASLEKEGLYKKEIEDSKFIMMSCNRENERLNEEIRTKKSDMEKLKTEYEMFKMKEKKYLEAEKQHGRELTELKNKNKETEDKLVHLEEELKNQKMCQESVQQENFTLQNQLQIIMNHKDNEQLFLRLQVDEILKQKEELEEHNKIKINELKLEINDLNFKIENERASYAALSQIHKEMSAKFIKSVNEAVDEKNAHTETLTLLREAEKQLETLKSDKQDLQEQVNILLDGLNDGKNRINTLMQERDGCQRNLEDLQKRYNDSLKKCLHLENRIREADFMKENCSGGDLDSETYTKQIADLKRESQEKQSAIGSLKQDISNLQQQLTACDFQKSELTLKLHEIQRKFETEQNLCERLKTAQKQILSSILQMREEGKLATTDSNNLVHIVQSSTNRKDSNDCHEK